MTGLGNDQPAALLGDLAPGDWFDTHCGTFDGQLDLAGRSPTWSRSCFGITTRPALSMVTRNTTTLPIQW
jgi:hypothetical protein